MSNSQLHSALEYLGFTHLVKNTFSYEVTNDEEQTVRVVIDATDKTPAEILKELTTTIAKGNLTYIDDLPF